MNLDELDRLRNDIKAAAKKVADLKLQLDHIENSRRDGSSSLNVSIVSNHNYGNYETARDTLAAVYDSHKVDLHRIAEMELASRIRAASLTKTALEKMLSDVRESVAMVPYEAFDIGEQS